MKEMTSLIVAATGASLVAGFLSIPVNLSMGLGQGAHANTLHAIAPLEDSQRPDGQPDHASGRPNRACAHQIAAIEMN